MANSKTPENYKVIAENRKASFNYFIQETLEVGLVLHGTEVKSLRLGKSTIAESHAAEKQGEIYLFNANIAIYPPAHSFNHDPNRPRKVLLKKRERNRLLASLQREGITLIPLVLYFNHKGRVKLKLGIAKGKRQYEKRETEKNREWQREKSRLLKHT